MKYQVTQSDLARACGVHPSTVSYALQNSPKISPDVRDRIRTKARELGYRPSPLYAALARRKKGASASGVPLVMLMSDNPTGPASPYAWDAFAQRAAELGYAPSLLNFREERASLSTLAHRLYHRGFVGVALSSWHDVPVAWSHNDWNRFSLVSCSGLQVNTPFHSIRNSAYAGLRLAWREVFQRGFQRIGPAICSHNPPLPDDEARLAAVMLEQSRLPPSHTLIPPFLGSLDDRTEVVAWFCRHRPDVVIGFECSHYHRLVEAGFRCPDDFAYCCLHTAPLPWFEGLAGVEENSNEIGRATVELLDQMIRHGEFGVPEGQREIHMPARFVPGRSLP